MLLLNHLRQPSARLPGRLPCLASTFRLIYFDLHRTLSVRLSARPPLHYTTQFKCNRDASVSANFRVCIVLSHYYYYYLYYC